ncbi:methyl-accepting chemotaxis protein [Lysinibacillus piscis]|uniref:Methyl-accepting chemotaxis protein n=1 Tax=Lysinibacillus piscis TaxID=2518931 RepID=A0ABQ5NJV8_9BACI|nr:methyl-accepting chemotaxis protein [Lysinibacillus sp. KH24]GLC88550.1 hypothetical protein LYSBPC_16770 [Lysinibacillus sp. KH24]
MSKLKRSLLYKYIASFTIPIVIISSIFSYVLFTTASRIIDDFVLTQFESSLQTISGDIVDKIDKYDIIAAENGSPNKYNKLVTRLNRSVEKYNIESVYILSNTGEKEHIVAMSDTDIKMQDYTFSKEMRLALETGDAQMSDIYQDEFGTHKAIFLPFKDTNFLLGLDMDASFITTLQTQILWVCIIMTAIFIAAGIIIAYFISIMIIKPIKKMTTYVEKVATGDLAAEALHISGSNEIAQLAQGIENMTADLRTLIQQISDNAEQVAAMSEELTAGSEQTSASIQQITSSMQEISAGSEKQTLTIDEVEQYITAISGKMSNAVASVNDITSQAKAASSISANGNTTIENAIEKMALTTSAIQETSTVVQRLNDYTNEIGDIITLIKAITDQTNLLALNASIEAARAGEHGKGFAVVAEEVRKLADQSLAATNNIREHIDTIREESHHAVTSMATSHHNLIESATTFSDSGEAFRTIYKQIQTLAEEVNHVNTNMLHMNEDIQHIVHSAEHMNAIAIQSSGNIQNVAAASEEQAASMEEITTSSNNLAEMAQQLRTIIQKFQL